MTNERKLEIEAYQRELDACRWLSGKLSIIEASLQKKIEKDLDLWKAKCAKVAKFTCYAEALEAYAHEVITEQELIIAHAHFYDAVIPPPETKYTVAMSMVHREIESLGHTCDLMEYEMLPPEQRKEADRKALLAQQKNQEYRHSLDAMVYAVRASKAFGKPFSEGHENGHSKEA